MNRRVLFAMPLAVLVACSGTEPNSPTVDQPTLFPVISDGANAGNPDFFFLPPMVPNPSGSPLFDAGAFNPNLNPTVTICALDLLPTAPESAVAVSTPCRTSGDAHFYEVISGTAALPAPTVSSEQYQVNWKVPSDAYNVYYRIKVSVGTTPPIGFADVHSVNSGKDLKNVNTGEFVPRQDGSTLPIKFRIEQFALCDTPGVGPCSSATVDPLTGGTVLFGGTPLHPTGGVTIPPQPGGGDPITVTIQLCDGNLPLESVFGSCLTINSSLGEAEELFPVATVFICDVLAAAADLDPEVRARIHLHRQHNNEDITVLPNDGAPFCNLPGDEGASNVGGLLRALVHGEWKKAGKQILGMLAPTPLYASRRLNLGAGGKTCCFSDFQFAEEATAEPPTAAATITSVSMNSTTLQIGGPATNYAAVIANNTGVAFGSFAGGDPVGVQGWVEQGDGPATKRAAGGTVLTCGATLGQLPAGGCTNTFSFSAGNSGAGFGTLVPGPATARFDLQYGPLQTIIHTFTVPITLIPLAGT